MTIQVHSNNPADDARVNALDKLSGGDGKTTEVEKVASAPATEAKAEVEEQNDGAPESETEAAETVDDTGLETETEPEAEEQSEEEETAEEVEAGQTDQKPKKKGGFQRRIDKKNAELADKDRALAAKDAEIQYLRELALKSAGKSTEKTSVAPPAAEKEPKPDDFPDDIDGYVKAKVDWGIKQDRKARDAETATTTLAQRQNELMDAHMKRVEEFASKNSDFRPLMVAKNQEVRMTPLMEQMVVTSEVGPQILYEFGKNPTEANRIAKLPPHLVTREMTKIEIRLAPPATGNKEPEPNKRITKAPKPLTTLSGTGSKSAAPKNIYEADRLSQAEYEAQRAEQRRQAASKRA